MDSSGPEYEPYTFYAINRVGEPDQPIASYQVVESIITLAEIERNVSGHPNRLVTWAREAVLGECYANPYSGTRLWRIA
jgi:hypothetical protein